MIDILAGGGGFMSESQVQEDLSLTLNKYRLPRLFSRLPLPAV